MKHKKIKRKKYQLGTSKQGLVRNYIQDPSMALYNNQIMQSKADYTSMNNPLAQGMEILGGAAMNYGLGQMQGMDFSKFALGGQVGQVPVEVEGDEVAQTPQGQMMQFKGATHEDGGIAVNLPSGTTISSDRIKIDGKSMADRKKKRTRKELTLTKLLENADDYVNQQTLKRTKENNAKQDADDLYLQGMIKDLQNSKQSQGQQQFGMGGKVKYDYGTDLDGIPMFTPSPFGTVPTSFLQKINPFGNIIENSSKGDTIGLTPPPKRADFSGMGVTNQFAPNITQLSQSAKNTDPATWGKKQPSALREMFGNVANQFTAGDLIGLGGQLINTFSPMKNTMKNRAGDTTNPNYYQDFGNDALDALDNTRGYLSQNRDLALRDLESSRVANTNRSRNSARGVNQQRGLDITSQMAFDSGQRKINSMYNSQLAQLGVQQAGLENQQDARVMQGAMTADIANRKDRDNYTTQIAKDLATKGFGLQNIGKSLNQNKYGQDTKAMIQSIRDMQIDDNQKNLLITMILKNQARVGAYNNVGKTAVKKKSKKKK